MYASLSLADAHVAMNKQIVNRKTSAILCDYSWLPRRVKRKSGLREKTEMSPSANHPHVGRAGGPWVEEQKWYKNPRIEIGRCLYIGRSKGSPDRTLLLFVTTNFSC